MASIRLTGAVCAGLLACVSTVADAQDQRGEPSGPGPFAQPARASADTVWALRSGLNVAALACRGADEHYIVAGYNNLLAAHRGELASVYQVVERGYGSPAAFDSAMTRLYNGYAQPAAQAALCANAAAVLDRLAANGERPLGEVADTALAQLQDAGPLRATAQIAVAAIPQLLDQRAAPPPPAPDPRTYEEAETGDE